MIKIVPSILTNSTIELVSLIDKCRGAVDRVQIDIVDGIFSENKTIDPEDLGRIDADFSLDYHLMVKEPIDWLERCTHKMVDRVIGQVELMDSQSKFISKAKELGFKVGLALDLSTPISQIDNGLLSSLDTILVMSVKAGRGGQEFDPNSIQKIEDLAEIRNRNSSSFSICDDGGVTLDWVDDEKRAGADEVIVGRRIFEGNLKENIEKYIKASNAQN